MRITPASAGRRVLIIVENLPVPFDRRVWQEATALQRQWLSGRGRSARRHADTRRATNASTASTSTGIRCRSRPRARSATCSSTPPRSSGSWCCRLKVLWRHGFDVIHACNPPDNIFLIGALFKALAGKRFLFDHHDINPELYEAKFGRRDFLYRLVLLLGAADLPHRRRVHRHQRELPADRARARAHAPGQGVRRALRAQPRAPEDPAAGASS